MPASKKNQRPKVKPQLRGRTTRRSGKALADPATNTLQLNDQLRELGLYAASTIGDGNCLFRALSDQMYGTDHYHAQLRRDVCDWIETHKQRYEPFVEDDRGLDTHLNCMRQNATYGGHMELSAFAHLSRKNVKVVQPGLVYVIEWDAGWDSQPPSPSTSAPPNPELRRSKRDKQPVVPSPTAADTVYVAYHDWEHFSSIRNLRGPHNGVPNVKESTGRTDDDESEPTISPIKSPPKKKKQTAAKVASAAATIPAAKLPKIKIKVPAPRKTDQTDPVQVPLPPSRSTSPAPSHTPSLPSNNPSLTHLIASHSHRSPKRSFDEASSSCSSESSSAAKRSRRSDEILPVPERKLLMEVDDVDLSTPSLSNSNSNSPYSSPEPELTPSPEPEPQPVVQRLTRRQRKALGLPKSGNASARVAVSARRGGGESEWAKNGSGRMDVRGFRELKI